MSALPALDTERGVSLINILILGLGVSGQAVLNFFKNQNQNQKYLNYKINIYDQTIPGSEKLLEPENLKKNQIIFASPGFDINGEILKKARELNIKISSDIDLFGELAELDQNIKIIGITGSNGKSTVTKMAFEMIQACGQKVFMGGNIGTSPLDFLKGTDVDLELPPSLSLASPSACLSHKGRDDIHSYNAHHEIFYVLEISSFQMEIAKNLKPTVGVFLNLSPNHLDRHKTMEIYGGLKQKLLDQSENQVVLEGLRANTRFAPAPLDLDEKIKTFGLSQGDFYLSPEGFLKYKDQDLIAQSDLANPEAHNVLNALAALAVIKTLNLDLEKACEVLKKYKPLPHRTQFVCEINGVKYINDSKATTIGATQAALEGFSVSSPPLCPSAPPSGLSLPQGERRDPCQKKIILLLGGQSKGQDFKDLKNPVDLYAKQVFIFGQDKNLILESLKQGILLENLEQAVNQAYLCAEPGDLVLLSPACASLDQFKNYEERGEHFVGYVKKLAQ